MSFENELYIQSFEKYWMNWEPKSWRFRSTNIKENSYYIALPCKSLKYIRKQVYIFLKIDCMITYLLHFFRICNYLNINYILFRGGGGVLQLYIWRLFSTWSIYQFIYLKFIYVFILFIHLLFYINFLSIYLFLFFIFFILKCVYLFTCIYCLFIHLLD